MSFIFFNLIKRVLQTRFYKGLKHNLYAFALKKEETFSFKVKKRFYTFLLKITTKKILLNFCQEYFCHEIIDKKHLRC
jgi:hypothetical protein